MAKEYKYYTHQYKCRFCGEIFHTNVESKRDLFCNKTKALKLSHSTYNLFENHGCNSDTIGIADLIGMTEIIESI